jgi:XTP/dITP diphosphohydrolase
LILYCATTNPGKLREFREAAGELTIEPVPGLAALPPCPEDGATFEENAIQKALCYGRHAPGLLFSDDSGLEVEALGGEPGVLSARYAGVGASDAQNNDLLLSRMVGIRHRSAKFVCVIALADCGRLVKTFRGEVEGTIADYPRGASGFGYDVVFEHPGSDRTFAELSWKEKLAVSHRGRAFRHFRAWLETRRA